MAKTNRLLIQTPEGIVFSQLLAGPVTRFLACAIDLACIVVLSSTLGTIIGVLGVISIDLARAISILLYFAASVGYSICLEWLWRGQTIGKKMLRLRVLDAQGLRLQFSQIAIRNLVRVVDMLPLFYLVGGVACLLNRKAQRLGDIAANTIVVRFPKAEQPDLDQILAGKYNSLREHPHLAARLRQRVNATEAGLALQAVLRRDSLDPAARVDLFAQMRAYFKAKVAFPPEADDAIADEQYVRNVVDLLYRARTEAAPLPALSPLLADEKR